MQKTLLEFGFKGVIDVREGMEGGNNGRQNGTNAAKRLDIRRLGDDLTL